jgi:site-specific DNA-methyltransferase (adenine-specific)
MKGKGDRADEMDANGRERLPPHRAITPEAQQWQGWGTALKPALEPITVARKPLAGTVAANVLQHETGAINVDGCRVGDAGRHPANLIHDGTLTLPGDAQRFFYCAKASKADRGEFNRHPTVKPTELMRYLCRLVTPPGGVVVDPFAGSGSTGKAARAEGFDFIGIEQDVDSYLTACRRVGVMP